MQLFFTSAKTISVCPSSCIFLITHICSPTVEARPMRATTRRSSNCSVRVKLTSLSPLTRLSSSRSQGMAPRKSREARQQIRKNRQFLATTSRLRQQTARMTSSPLRWESSQMPPKLAPRTSKRGLQLHQWLKTWLDCP